MPPLPTPKPTAPLRDTLGFCQWFHYEDHATLDRAIALMHDLGARHLRTGISWADYHQRNGKKWYDHQMSRLADSGLEILLSVWHTPPSLSEGDSCNSPPRRLQDYADFIDRLLTDYGHAFHHLEFWNEPNNRYKWNFPAFDPHWQKFAEMIGAAAYWTKQRTDWPGTTVLGGMIPVDGHWLDLMNFHGVLNYIDTVALHAFPGMWFPNHPNWDWQRDWHGWPAKLGSIAPNALDKPIWITETGLATWDLALEREAKYELQSEKLLDLAHALPLLPPNTRAYWYSLIDLDPAREAIEGYHVDENEYHMGLVKHDGYQKDAFYVAQDLLSAPTPV